MAVMVAAFSLNFAGIAVKRSHVKADAFSDTVLYTTNTSTSQSNVNVNVEHIFVSDDDRQCFIMLKFDNMKDISTNASNYWMTVCNRTDKGDIADAPTEGIKGRVYMFGATGYCAVYLYTTGRPFDNVLKQINILSQNISVRGEQVDVNGDVIESTPDVFSIYVNPAGNDGQTASFIKNHKIGDDFDMSVIYERLIYYPEETEIKKNLDETTQTLQTKYNQIIEYRDRLGNYDLMLPAVPEYITGDTFENNFEYEPVYQTDNNGNIITDDITGEPVCMYDENNDIIYKSDANGKPVVKNAYLDFKPATVFPNGIMLDYHNLSLKDTGYFNYIDNRGDMSIPEYIKYLSDSKLKDDNAVINNSEYVWKYSDGTDVSFDNSDSLTQIMKTDVEAYKSLLDEYIAAKTLYQCTLLPSLLTVEYNLSVMSSVYTDTMYEKDLNVPVLDENGSPVLDADGNQITEVKTMYVDDDVCSVYGKDVQ